NSARIVYPKNIAISKNNILYVGYNSGLFVRNLSTNTNISCTASGNLWYIRNAYGTAVDPSASNIYVQYSRYLYRFAIQGNYCPSTSYASRAYRYSWQYGFGMRFHPTDDSILYATSYYEHKLYKYTLSGQKNVFTSAQSVGRCCSGSSSSSNVIMYYPSGVAVDTANNRVIAVSYYKHSAQAFDLNLGFLKEIGGSAGTRMTGAHEAIKAIVTDSSLTAGVNFGFAYWASGSSGFKSWSGNITTGKAKPCTSQNCLKVRAHKQGASRINQIITSVNPGGGTDAMAWARIASQYYLSNKYSPIDKNLDCQNSYVLVIGDGVWYNHSSAKGTVQNLLNKHKIKTFTVAYGGGIGSSC
ncbi:uncharacterized protein METZ01_LOCUS255118, partial [marine metagenome]